MEDTRVRTWCVGDATAHTPSECGEVTCCISGGTDASYDLTAESLTQIMRCDISGTRRNWSLAVDRKRVKSFGAELGGNFAVLIYDICVR